MNLNFKELRVGGFFVLVGLAFGIEAYLKIPIGSPARMGPGFFPVILSTVLVGLGLMICVRAGGAGRSPVTFVSLRGLVPVLTAPLVFGFTVRGLGFAPAVMLTTALTALASPAGKPAAILLLAAGMAAFCTLVFIYGAGVPIDVVGPWLKR